MGWLAPPWYDGNTSREVLNLETVKSFRICDTTRSPLTVRTRWFMHRRLRVTNFSERTFSRLYDPSLDLKIAIRAYKVRIKVNQFFFCRKYTMYRALRSDLIVTGIRRVLFARSKNTLSNICPSIIIARTICFVRSSSSTRINRISQTCT